MSEPLALARRRALMLMGGAAVVAVLLGGASMIPPRPPKARAEAGQLVLKDFASHAKDVNLVMVTTAHDTYHLVHNGDVWALPEKGNYPVRADRIAALISALSQMRYDRAMTRDEKKFDRIGLGDPAQGGGGALLEVSDAHGAIFAKFIVGYRDGKTYVREPDDLQAWAVAGIEANAMPPLLRAARWLDLDAVTVPADQIAEVEVRPGLTAYKLVPADAQGGAFKLAPPNADRVAAGFGLALIAQALTRFSPSDVATADQAPETDPVSIHITRTRSGVEIIARAWRAADKGWVKLSAAPLKDASSEAATQAQAINDRAKGWAFQMTEADWTAYATPLDQLTIR